VLEEISWQVELALRPGKLHGFRSLTREMVQAAKREPGVLIYERYIDEKAAVVQLYERYRDSACALGHLRAFSATYGERFAELVERKRLSVFGTPSAELKSVLDGFGARYFDRFDGFSSPTSATSS
jgi:quinol monooxygenase YgiN